MTNHGSTERVQALTQEHAGIVDPAERLIIMMLLLSRVASGQELKDKDMRNVRRRKSFRGGRIGKDAWPWINEFLDLLAEKDPDRALETAVALCLLPQSQDSNQESINSWMRTSGLTLLGEKAVLAKLPDYFKDGEHGDTLGYYLDEQMNVDITRFDTGEKFRDPQGFCTLQATYLALTMRPTNLVASMFNQLGRRRAGQDDIQFAADIAREFPKCDHFLDLIKL